MKFIRILRANNNLYYFINKCSDYDDGNEVQEIVHWDDFCSNDYFIQDEYFDNKIIEVLPTEQALKMISKTCATPKNIEYAAINHDLDILWLYDTNGIHWFYGK